MSRFLEYTNTIQVGDWVVLYSSRDHVNIVKMEPNGFHTTRHGKYNHDQMIGQKYGTRLASSNGRGFLTLLHPTAEWWTATLPHRTQILYLADISMVTLYLELKPGKVVVESGTGSGSFTHSLARTVAPTGKVYTFEYHEERANQAKLDFEAHGISSVTEIQWKDVCKDGFGLDSVADAVFLDLPSPWDAIVSAKKALKKNQVGKICCFSPCIEQVQKSCMTLYENGFTNITMREVLTKNYDVRTVSVKSLPWEDDTKNVIVSRPVQEVAGHTAFLTFADLYPIITKVEVDTIKTEPIEPMNEG